MFEVPSIIWVRRFRNVIKIQDSTISKSTAFREEKLVTINGKLETKISSKKKTRKETVVKINGS